ncbi:pfs domain-containing protein [Colletotrichum simmondsii]|uniref:Pfs domain-containing protein n=1 Tax=Colletotrichum simmondsii TaxID=703756 RepID=A0A135SHU4_9PEZI|nr:pfs domain-containing protein [Colletotrichum simmondsii]
MSKSANSAPPAGFKPAEKRVDFDIALICALETEFDAAELVFDEKYSQDFGKESNDKNNYVTGRIGKFNVVLCLLGGKGKVHTAASTAELVSSYKGLQLVLLVGVCGGVPFPHAETNIPEIILGDVVISNKLVQSDFGKQKPAESVPYDNDLGRQTKSVRNLLRNLQTESNREKVRRAALEAYDKALSEAQDRGKYERPPSATDILYQSDWQHVHAGMNISCDCRPADVNPQICDNAFDTRCEVLGCDDDEDKVVKRNRLNDPAVTDPAQWAKNIFIGPYVSSDNVIKSAWHREELSKKHKIAALEMEGAGMWEMVPGLVVKSVSDYGDSHKHKEWQSYAALLSACTTKAILEVCTKVDKPDDSKNGGGSRDHFTNSGSGPQNNNTGSGNQTNQQNTGKGTMNNQQNSGSGAMSFTYGKQ